jgi:hypothetical protein
MKIEFFKMKTFKKLKKSRDIFRIFAVHKKYNQWLDLN